MRYTTWPMRFIPFGYAALAVAAMQASLCAQEPGNPVEANDGQQIADDGNGDGAAENGDAVAMAPPAKTDKWNDAHSIPRSDRFHVYWPKLLVIWLLFIIWVRSVDFVNRDSQIYDLGYGKWNAIIFFPVFAVLVVVVFPLFLPLPSNFIVAVVLLSISYLATFIPFVVVRNKSVERHERVFTPDWFRFEIAQAANKVGIKMSAERKADYEKGAPVDLMAMGAPQERDNQANLIVARQSPGYLVLKELIAEMADKRSDRVLLDYTQQSVLQRHHIDGVWHNGDARDRESGDVMLAVMKSLANLDMTERRKKQEGRFGAKYKDVTYLCPIVSQGVKTGERVTVQLLGGKRDELKTFAELGMREKPAESWSELMAANQGLLLISGLPEGGITTLTDVSLMETDRLMRDFFSIEEAHHLEREIENIEVVTYDAAEGQSPASILEAVIRKYPDVLVVRDFVDTKTAQMLFDEIGDQRLVITNVHAKSAPEALLRMLQKKVPQRDFAAVVTAVLNTRLIRMLCEKCKVGYEPSPDMLKKLGIPTGKVDVLYRVPKPEEADKPCEHCGAVGYFGRTGLFEVLRVDEKIREILVKQPKLELLQKGARAAGMRTLQEEGLLLVARGLTSIQELQRVLKQ